MAWGYHMIVDAYNAPIELISSAPNIEVFAKTLVNRIDMKAYGEPQIIHFGDGDKEGYTLVQLIETSNITAHFSEDTGNFYLDVFSCREYDREEVIKTVNQFFKPERIIERFFERGIRYEEEA